MSVIALSIDVLLFIDIEYYNSQGWNLSDVHQTVGPCRPGLTFPPCDSVLCRPTPTVGPPVYTNYISLCTAIAYRLLKLTL